MDNFLFLPRAFAAAVLNIGFACATGLVLLAVLIPREQPRIRRAMPAVWAAILVALLLQLWLTVATMTGSIEPSTMREAFTDVLAGTHAGIMVGCSVVAAVLGLACSVTVRGKDWTRSAIAVLVLLAALRSASGHSAVDGFFSATEFVQFLHLASTAVWSGGIIVSSMFVFKHGKQVGDAVEISVYMRTLSRVATVCVAIVLLTGVYNSYRSVGRSFTLPDHSQWGGFLIAKVLLVCLALGMGAYSRSIVHAPIEMSAASLSRLAMALRLEAAAMVLILAVSALLANSPMPMQP